MICNYCEKEMEMFDHICCNCGHEVEYSSIAAGKNGLMATNNFTRRFFIKAANVMEYTGRRFIMFCVFIPFLLVALWMTVKGFFLKPGSFSAWVLSGTFNC